MSIQRIAVIPAYEPDEKLIDLVRNISNNNMTAVVVDDGSGPDYDEVFRSTGHYAKVLRYDTNGGKGHALKTAYEYICDHYNEACSIVTMDSDGQHRPTDALRLCMRAENRPGTLILGSRKMNRTAPLRSRIGNGITRTVFQLISGTKIYDTQTGLRAFTGDLLPEMIAIEGERYEYEMNVLLHFAEAHIPMEEVEIATIYIDDNSGSHFDTLKDSFRIYREILKFSASSLISFGIDFAVYSLLSLLTSGMSESIRLPLSNIGARIVSSIANYTINRKVVFHSEESIQKSALQYFTLAALILAGNTLVLGVLVDTIGINRYVAKVMTELFFFLISWTVQKYCIFGRKEMTA